MKNKDISYKNERKRKYNIKTKYIESFLYFVSLLITIHNTSQNMQHITGDLPWVVESKRDFGAA
jgi:hypothetical protein